MFDKIGKYDPKYKSLVYFNVGICMFFKAQRFS